MYFNILSFLNNASPPTNTQSSIDVVETDGEDPTINPDIPASREGPYQAAMVPKKRKPQDEIGKQLINVLKESAEDRRKRENDSLDEDRLFFMSLVTDFKKIPQNKKLSAKRQILSVIEQHQQCGNSSNVDYQHAQDNFANSTLNTFQQASSVQFDDFFTGSHKNGVGHYYQQQQPPFTSTKKTKNLRPTPKNTVDYCNPQASTSMQTSFQIPTTSIEKSYTELQPASRKNCSTPLSMTGSEYNEDQHSPLMSCFTDNSLE